jgi:outer membrane protein OmpA-like peptidoglycan-associated protein
MEFKNGAWEIVEWQGQRWLRGTEYNSSYFVVLPEALPSRFTMEFDYGNPSGACAMHFIDASERNVTVEYNGDGSVRLYNQQAEIDARGQYAQDGDATKIRKARILGDGKYIKVYVDDKRILNVPNGDIGRSNKIRFDCEANVDKPAMFANFRIAESGKRLYDALAADGRVATQGILFDTSSDRIRPESTPTLKEIGTMLTEHPELKLLIEGHTDGVGEDAANLTLSDKRAAAVKAYLVEKYAVGAARLQTRGLGETNPVAANDTAEGRQQNRRVELVKL